MHLRATEIAAFSGGHLVAGREDRLATALCWDSRVVTQDSLYAALPGERVDGHDFCVDAARAGASIVLVSRELDAHILEELVSLDASVVLVDTVEQALSKIAGGWRTQLKGEVIAITGSSGKTTTKELVAAVLAARGSVVATEGNRNNEIGVPATILSADIDTDFVVVEMGMRGEGQLAELCTFVRPSAALVTNVGTSHMELLGSREAIARAKAEPYLALEPGRGIAFASASDPYTSALLSFGRVAERDIELVLFDGSGSCSCTTEDAKLCVCATDISYDAAGNPSFTLRAAQESARCTLALAGAHNVHNAAAAAAVGLRFGLSLAQAAEALAACLPPEGRQRVLVGMAGETVIDDSYNANPDSMCASLAAFQSMAVAGKRVAVLGDMYELGSFSEEGHALAGRAAANTGIDQLICVGDLGRGIAAAACEAGMDTRAVHCVATADEALAAVAGTLEEGDAILVKASHSLGLDAVVKGLVG